MIFLRYIRQALIPALLFTWVAGAAPIDLGEGVFDAALGGANRFLFVATREGPAIRVFDLERREELPELFVGEDFRLAAGRSWVLVQARGKSRMFRWHIPSFAQKTDLKLELTPAAMVMAADGGEELFIYADPSKGKCEDGWFVVDPGTGRMRRDPRCHMEYLDPWRLMQPTYISNHSFRVNAPGNLWQFSLESQGRMDMGYAAHWQADGFDIRGMPREQQPYFPAADGDTILGCGSHFSRRFPSDTVRLGRSSHLRLPDETGGTLLELSGANASLGIRWRSHGQPELDAALPGIEGFGPLGGAERCLPGGLPGNKRFWFVGKHDVLAAIDAAGRRLFLHPLGLSSAKGWPARPTLLNPSRQVFQPGKSFSLDLICADGRAPYRYSAVSAPEGMGVREDGRVTWLPELKPWIQPLEAEVEAVDADGQKTRLKLSFVQEGRRGGLEGVQFVSSAQVRPGYGHLMHWPKMRWAAQRNGSHTWFFRGASAFRHDTGRAEWSAGMELPVEPLGFSLRDTKLIVLDPLGLDYRSADTLAQLHRIPLPPGHKGTEMISHPGGGISYVVTYPDAEVGDAGSESGTIREFHEEKGLLVEIPGLRGDRIALSTDGRFLFAVIPATPQAGDVVARGPFELEPRPRVVVAYDLTGETIRVAGLSKPLPKPVEQLLPTPDGEKLLVMGEHTLYTPAPYLALADPVLSARDLAANGEPLSLPGIFVSPALHPNLPILFGISRDFRAYNLAEGGVETKESGALGAPQGFDNFVSICLEPTGRWLLAATENRASGQIRACTIPNPYPNLAPVANPVPPPVFHSAARPVDEVLAEKIHADGRGFVLVGATVPAEEFRACLEPPRNAPDGTLAEAGARLKASVGTIRSGNQAVGTGFFVGATGYVLTCHHVAMGDNLSVVVTRVEPGGESRLSYPAKRVAFDASMDAALLVLDARGQRFPVAPLGVSRDLAMGDEVAALGNPGLGDGRVLDGTYSEGIISHAGRKMEGMRLLQTTAAVNPGSSGGPLLDVRGRVVGMISSGSPRLQNVGFAVPSDDLARFLRACLESNPAAK